LAVCQRVASTVLPVSVSFEVEGQRTSKLLMLGPAFDFGRRGGSKKNRLAISEPINDARLGCIVGRHLHFYSITNRQSDETLAHLPGDMRENEMVIGKRNSKHGSRKHSHDGALNLNGLFRIHDVRGFWEL